MRRVLHTAAARAEAGAAAIVVNTNINRCIEYGRRLSDKFNVPLGHGATTPRFILEVIEREISSPRQSPLLESMSDRISVPAVQLRDTERPHMAPFCLDFAEGDFRQWLRSTRNRIPNLVKACGWSQKRPPSLLDLTGGWGRDAVTLSTLRCGVTVFERHPVVACILWDALQRLSLDESSAADAAAGVRMVHTDAHVALSEAERHAGADDHLPDVLYIDGMFPPRFRSAAVRGPMQYLLALCGPGSEEATMELAELALRWAGKRVVVKMPRGTFRWREMTARNRSRGDRPLCWKAPSFSISGKSVRYDVFLIADGKAER